MSETPVVVITGASSGIGRATARAFAQRGARLVLAARGELHLVASECEDRGAAVVSVVTDVAEEAQVQALADAAIARFGRIDAWVGAAGAFAYGTFAETPPAVFRRLIETNLMGQVHGARAVLPLFRAQGSGALILVGSLFSRVGAPFLAPYVTSKFGVLGFAEVLRQEHRAERGIRIRAILPASIDTPIYQHAANVTGRGVHPLPPVVAPERVAAAIVRSVRSRRPVVVVGRVQGSAALLHAVSLPAWDAAISAVFATIAVRGKGPRDSDGTVFSGVRAGSGPVRGGWASPALRAAGWVAAAVTTLLLAHVARRR